MDSAESCVDQFIEFYSIIQNKGQIISEHLLRHAWELFCHDLKVSTHKQKVKSSPSHYQGWKQPEQSLIILLRLEGDFRQNGTKNKF